MADVKKLRPGNYIVHKEQPYVVKKNQIVVTGTHSHTKNKVELQNLFTGQSETITLPPHDKVKEVEIIRKKGQIISKSRDKVQVMDPNTYETFDVETELFDELSEGDEVTYVEFRGATKILEKR